MKEFNKQQQGAAHPARGIHLVIAGPGTGKTRTMIERINNTVKEFNVDPENLLILTFSRRAAEEIRERLSGSSGTDYSAAFAGTFHSFCLRLLMDNRRLYLEHTGMKSFPSVIDRERQDTIMKELFMRNPERFMGIPYDAVMKIMNRQRPFPEKTAARIASCGLSAQMELFRDEYRQYKHGQSLIDYTDMTTHAAGLLSSSSEVREKVQAKYRFIFIDEFQDTSHEDFSLLSLAAGDNAGIFMVGDDYQSIYRFRGARVEYLVNARRFFNGAIIHKLTVNYRSHMEIVRVSNLFISHNSFRSKKNIVSARGRGGSVIFIRTSSFRDEAHKVSHITGSADETRSCAVLCRNNYQVNRLRSLVPHSGKNLSFLTMHASKGLEFDRVIICGVSDGIIPDRDTDIEDERRLFYVALTRAKSELYIIYESDDNGRMPRFITECGFTGGKLK